MGPGHCRGFSLQKGNSLRTQPEIVLLERETGRQVLRSCRSEGDEQGVHRWLPNPGVRGVQSGSMTFGTKSFGGSRADVWEIH